MTDLRYTEEPYDAYLVDDAALHLKSRNNCFLTLRPSTAFSDDYAAYFVAVNPGLGSTAIWLTFEQFDKIAAYVAALKRERGVD